MYRKFSLVNGNNATWDLTNELTKTFASNPLGLGLRLTFNSIRLGNKQKVTKKQYEFVNKEFDVIFYGNTNAEIYDNYTRFINFITAGDISLQYQIPSQELTYRIDVLISELDKTEVKDSGYMTCKFALTPLSFWEDAKKNVIEISAAQTESSNSSTLLSVSSEPTAEYEAGPKKYGLTRQYYYAVSDFDEIEITINGTIETSLEITIDGSVTDPQYSLFDAKDNLVGIGKFDGSFNYVYVNSDELNEEIILKQNNVVLTNPFNYQDIDIGDNETSKVTFLTLNKGYNKMSFNLGATFDGTVRIEWRNRYVSV